LFKETWDLMFVRFVLRFLFSFFLGKGGKE